MKTDLRILSDDLKQVAKEELNEQDDRINDDIDFIREWLKKQPHINAREGAGCMHKINRKLFSAVEIRNRYCLKKSNYFIIGGTLMPIVFGLFTVILLGLVDLNKPEKQWLVAFLRGCKYSLERTKEKIDMYYTVRNLVPEYLQNRDPFAPEIQRLLDIGSCLPLPKLPYPGAPRVILMRSGIYDGSKTKPEDVLKLHLMIHDILLNEDDNFVVAGETVVIDLKGFNFGQMMITPAQLKKAVMCFQQAYPLRIKGGHFIYPTPTFETLYGLLKMFASSKIQKRLCVYSQKNQEDLYKVVPKDVLPEEYGGNGGKLADLIAQWKAKVESYSDWFKADSLFKTDEKKRPGAPKTTEAVFGLEGSFRKLNVD